MEAFEYGQAVLRKSVFLDQLGEKYADRAKAAPPVGDELILNETHLYDDGAVYTAKRRTS